MSQNLKIREQIVDSLTNPDDLMDTGGQTLFGVVTANHLGEENTQIADDQILELNFPKNDMDQFSEETLENGVMALSKITETPIPTSKCATGTLRDRTSPP